MTQIFCRRLNLEPGIVSLGVGLSYDLLRFIPCSTICLHPFLQTLCWGIFHFTLHFFRLNNSWVLRFFCSSLRFAFFDQERSPACWTSPLIIGQVIKKLRLILILKKLLSWLRLKIFSLHGWSSRLAEEVDWPKKSTDYVDCLKRSTDWRDRLSEGQTR